MRPQIGETLRLVIELDCLQASDRSLGWSQSSLGPARLYFECVTYLELRVTFLPLIKLLPSARLKLLLELVLFVPIQLHVFCSWLNFNLRNQFKRLSRESAVNKTLKHFRFFRLTLAILVNQTMI